jgi:hypothetical protein
MFIENGRDAMAGRPKAKVSLSEAERDRLGVSS